MVTELSIVANPDALHQRSHAAALAEGLRAHGVAVEVVRGPQDAATAHVACWGWRCGRQLRERGKQVLVMERGYLGDRFAWTSLGWNGLNNFAAFPHRRDGARFRKNFGHLLKPWTPVGRYILLIGQVPGDMSLRGMNMATWYAQQVREAARYAHATVVFRPHPVAVERGYRQAVDGTTQLDGDLASQLAGAALVVTFNSNTGVDSLLAGKPTVVADEGGMAWSVAPHSISEATGAAEPARQEWLARLAWCQWTLDEIRSGEAWATVGAITMQQLEAA